MSSMTPEDSANPEHSLTPTEIENRDRLEALAQDGLGTYVQVGGALAEIRDRHLYRDSHPSFEAYLRERWAANVPGGGPLSPTTIRVEAPARSTADGEPRAALLNRPCEALARACEETLSALADDDRLGVEILLAILKQGSPGVPADGESFDLWQVAEPTGGELLSTLRWLLTQANGTIGEVAHHLETRAADIDDRARAQLREDVLVLDGELAVVKGLLVAFIDWDSELGRLLGDKLPPFDTETDPEDED